MSSTMSRAPMSADLTGTFTQQLRPLDLDGRAVLLATDGSAGSLSAARVALALAVKHHAVVHVVNVVDSRPAPIPPPLDIAIAMADAVSSPAVHERQVMELRGSLSAATGEDIDWPARIMLGTPSHAIVQESRRIGAALIIMGLRRHGRVDRAVHDETALNVMRAAGAPVLAVTPELTTLPSRILCAMDFSETSVLAGRAACSIAAPVATLVLGYVPPISGFMPHDGEGTIHELGVQAGFARLAQQLGNEHVTVDHVVLHRELPRPTAELLLEYADSAHIGLIAAGSARHGRLDRWMMGSVSTDLVRDGRHSVLIVPPRDTLRH